MELEKQKSQAGIKFILVTIFIDVLGIGIIIPVLPELVKSFVEGNDESTASFYVGLIGASYALMQFVFSPILGALSDRFGRRPILLASLFGLGVDFIIQGLAPSIAWLFFGRVLAGMMGASITTANAYIADISTPETRARNFGFVGGMFGLGFIFGPAIGGQLGYYNLRLPFFIAAALALVNWLYGFFVLPESLDPKNRSKFSWRRASPFGAFGLLTKYPIVWGLGIAFFCMSLAQRGLESVWVLFTTYRYGWDTRTNGWALLLVGLMAAIVQGGGVRPIVKRLGARNAVRCGFIIASLTFLGYGLATSGWMIPILIVFGSFGYIAQPAMQTIITSTVSSTEQGKMQGALVSLMSLTSIIAPLIFTTCLFGYFTSEEAPLKLPGIPFFVGSVLWALAFIIADRVFRTHPETDLSADEGKTMEGQDDSD